MTIKIWFLLIFGLANYPLPTRADAEKKTCGGHEKWTVFQRRKYGNVSFFRGWDDYVKGFGDCEGDLWLGLETLHELTKGDDMSLEINMMSKDQKDHLVARYSSFSLGPGSDFYRLHVSGYSGNPTGDGLTHSNNVQFSTKDADHDWCAFDNGGSWWFHNNTSSRISYCALGYLNGNFNRRNRQGIWWRVDDYRVRLLCCSEMKIYRRFEG